jgi:hypothetical protein
MFTYQTTPQRELLINLHFIFCVESAKSQRLCVPFYVLSSFNEVREEEGPTVGGGMLEAASNGSLR